VELKLQSLQLPMLDWTTSFLSDAFIIRPTLLRCQTISIATLDLVGATTGRYKRLPLGRRKKTPRIQYGAFDENQTNRGNSPETSKKAQPLEAAEFKAIGTPAAKWPEIQSYGSSESRFW